MRDYPEPACSPMSDYDVRIERLANGYTIRVRDPKIVKANEAPRKAGVDRPWKDPNREYVFTDIESVLAWIKKHLDKALPADEFDSAFDAAMVEDDE